MWGEQVREGVVEWKGGKQEGELEGKGKEMRKGKDNCKAEGKG